MTLGPRSRVIQASSSSCCQRHHLLDQHQAVVAASSFAQTPPVRVHRHFLSALIPPPPSCPRYQAPESTASSSAPTPPSHCGQLESTAASSSVHPPPITEVRCRRRCLLHAHVAKLALPPPSCPCCQAPKSAAATFSGCYQSSRRSPPQRLPPLHPATTVAATAQA
ncbi:hypothetical protein E2562_031956 [Oryza meyeriana var. granulata]|uniref:Uncharacterized protein n=1 Tax=Oryza meyeriana var. granulata TaxID=110450 RepID=A0A6G1ERR0_9ORYZ|nr:hypothetical protein E2562_031956 [Oryza meyeriana var. granulata]